MSSLKERPHNLLLLTALIILVFSFFGFDKQIDVHLHDTYFIIPMAFLFWAIIVVLILLWLVYSIAMPFLFARVLTWIHLTLTCVILIFLVIVFFYSHDYYTGLAGMPRRYYDYGDWNILMQYDNLTKTIFVTILIFIIGLLLFVINLIIGLFKTK